MYEWQMSIDKVVGSGRSGCNKLRFYRIFKRFYGTEHYCTVAHISCHGHTEQHLPSLDVEWHPLMLKLDDTAISQLN